LIARKIHYFGSVQGVGFRYTARDVAAGFAVAGYVRNLDNGEVELVAQGEAAEVDRFLAALEERMTGYIEGRRDEDEPVGRFDRFEIRRF
jgi:acylphosphatase